MAGKTYPIRLDEQREIAYPTKQVAMLDEELGQKYGRGMTYFLQQMDPERTDVIDLRMDVLAAALRHGLRGGSNPGIRTDAVYEMIDASPLPEVEIWATVAECYMEERGMSLEREDEAGNAEGPASRSTADAGREMSVPS